MIVEKLRELIPLLPSREYGAVKSGLYAAIKHIRQQDELIQEQERHLARLRAALLRGNDDR